MLKSLSHYGSPVSRASDGSLASLDTVRASFIVTASIARVSASQNGRFKGSWLRRYQGGLVVVSPTLPNGEPLQFEGVEVELSCTQPLALEFLDDLISAASAGKFDEQFAAVVKGGV